MDEPLKPIHKFNGGIGATLCHQCRVIISTGLTQETLCNDCKKNNEPLNNENPNIGSR